MTRSQPRAAMTPVAIRPLAALLLGLFALLMVTANGYGFHRDELYFMEAGRHPAWGYDDQPPLTPLIARGSTALFGNTPAGLRVPSALAMVACTLLTALTARELGGGRRAQVVGALALATSALVFTGHLVSTTSYDFLGWTLLLYLVVRIRQRDEPRLWLVFGLVLGVALENKWLPVTLVATLLIAALLSGDVRAIRSRWLAGGLLLALALWLPNLIWQADHGWPQRELANQIAQDDPVGARIKFLPFQLLIVSPFLVYIWLAGLRWLLRAPEAGMVRVLGFGYLVLLALCLLTGAKEYYAIGWYPLLLAAGAVALEPRWAEQRARRRLALALVVSAAIAWTIQLPLTPQSAVHANPLVQVNKDTLETIGWRRFVDSVAQVRQRLPPAQRARAVIFTANYGEAGAIQQYGRSRGLPRAYSGHNSFARFAEPPAAGAPVIAIGFRDRAYLARFFRDCRLALRFDNRLQVDNEEQGAPIDVCTGPMQPWPRLWPRLHHLDA